jgi:DtxR family transcriptional regulator, Mn-dependent transcriptional regulator
MKSESIGDYLKTIYLIQADQNGLPVSTTSLASRLSISNASVTGMLKHLSSTEPRLVEYKPYYGVTLSEMGIKEALEIIRRHRLLESYLHQKLGYTWDEVHAEADRLEHVISTEMEERLALALDDPLTDPHGDPIPDKNGNVPKETYLPLTKLPEGKWAKIQRVTGQNPEFLRYLATYGLLLDTKLEIESKTPLNGPISIRFLETGKPVVAIGWEVAQNILVQPITVLQGEIA